MFVIFMFVLINVPDVDEVEVILTHVIFAPYIFALLINPDNVAAFATRLPPTERLVPAAHVMLPVNFTLPVVTLVLCVVVAIDIDPDASDPPTDMLLLTLPV